MKDLPHGVCRVHNSVYRRFKVKRNGRWVDHYVKLPQPDDDGFRRALAQANADAAAGAFGHEIGVK